MKTPHWIIRVAILLVLAAAPTRAEGKPKLATVDLESLVNDDRRTIDAQRQAALGQAEFQRANMANLSRMRRLQMEVQTLQAMLLRPDTDAEKRKALSRQLALKSKEAADLDAERKTGMAKVAEETSTKREAALQEVRKDLFEKAKKVAKAG